MMNDYSENYFFHVQLALSGGWIYSLWGLTRFRYRYNPFVANVILSFFHCLFLSDFSFSDIRACMIDFPLVQQCSGTTSSIGREFALFRFIPGIDYDKEVLLKRVKSMERPLMAFTLIFTFNFY